MGGYGCKKYLAVFVGPAHFIVFIAPVARLRFMTTRGTCHCAAAPPSSREASHFRGVFQVRLLPRDFEKSIRHACHFQVKEFYRDSLRHKTPLSLFIHYIQCNIPVRIGHVADRSLTHMLAFPLTRGAMWQCSLTWVTSRRLAGGRRSRRNLGPLI